jgi:hypothetical protein
MRESTITHDATTRETAQRAHTDTRGAPRVSQCLLQATRTEGKAQGIRARTTRSRDTRRARRAQSLREREAQGIRSEETRHRDTRRARRAPKEAQSIRSQTTSKEISTPRGLTSKPARGVKEMRSLYHTDKRKPPIILKAVLATAR